MDVAKLNDLRQRIDAGIEVTNEEILEGLRQIKQARTERAAGVAKKVAASPVNIGTIDLKALIAAKFNKPNT